MSWLQHTQNPKALLGYYGQAPRLDNVTLHALMLKRDGPTAELVLDLGQFPTKPSTRWPAGSNTCQVTLQAVGLERVTLQRWGTGVLGALEVTARSGLIQLSCTGEARFELACLQVFIAKVTGYKSSEA
jgi:hypothetical protein